MRRLCVMALTVALLALGGWTGKAGAAPVMVEKNLFHPERKPVAPKEYKTSAQRRRRVPDVSKRFQLDAIFYYDHVKTALIRVRFGGFGSKKAKRRSPYVRVKEKDTIGDYKVVAIYPKGIELEGYGEKAFIPLFQKGKISPPPAPLPKARVIPQPSSPKTKTVPTGKVQKQPVRPPTPAQVDEKLRQLKAFQAQILSQGRNGKVVVPPGMKATDVKETLDQLKRAIETLQQKKP